MFSWFLLLLAGCAEVIGVGIMKKFVETKRNIFLLCLAISFSFSFGFLSLAMQNISMGVAYAIWTGIGAAGSVIIGIMFFNERKSFMKLFFVFLIIASSIGLKLMG